MLHRVDEGILRRKNQRTVLHKGDEGHIAEKKSENRPS